MPSAAQNGEFRQCDGDLQVVGAYTVNGQTLTWQMTEPWPRHRPINHAFLPQNVLVDGSITAASSTSVSASGAKLGASGSGSAASSTVTRKSGSLPTAGKRSPFLELG